MRTKIMGVINLAPDSFYEGSRADAAQALQRGLQMAADGADILDLGGESTRPGSEPVSAAQEMARVLPAIESLSGKTRAKISVDTCKPEVAQAAIGAGGQVVNDVTGMQLPQMREIVAQSGVECVIMHMQGTPKTMQAAPSYVDVVGEIKSFLEKRVSLCENEGIDKRKIIVDPGIGFGKTTVHNLEILRNIGEFKKIGCRVLVGASRKSFIGKLLGSEANPLQPEERLEGSLAIAAYCALAKVDILRVHDVKETVRAVSIAENLAVNGH